MNQLSILLLGLVAASQVYALPSAKGAGSSVSSPNDQIDEKSVNDFFVKVKKNIKPKQETLEDYSDEKGYNPDRPTGISDSYEPDMVNLPEIYDSNGESISNDYKRSSEETYDPEHDSYSEGKGSGKVDKDDAPYHEDGKNDYSSDYKGNGEGEGHGDNYKDEGNDYKSTGGTYKLGPFNLGFGAGAGAGAGSMNFGTGNDKAGESDSKAYGFRMGTGDKGFKFGTGNIGDFVKMGMNFMN